MTVEDMRRRMSNQEFTYWRMYYSRIAQRKELEVKRRG